MDSKRFSEMSSSMTQHGFSGSEVVQTLSDQIEIERHIEDPNYRLIAIALSISMTIDVRFRDAAPGDSATTNWKFKDDETMQQILADPGVISYLEAKVFKTDAKRSNKRRWFGKRLLIPSRIMQVKWHEDIQDYIFSGPEAVQALPSQMQIVPHIKNPDHETIVYALLFFMTVAVKFGDATPGDSATKNWRFKDDEMVQQILADPNVISYMEYKVFKVEPKWFNKLLGIPVKTMQVKWHEDVQDYIFI